MSVEADLTKNTTSLQRTTLHSLHIDLGASMVPFAGYDMPVQYPMGIMAEHNHARSQAGLFDVSHMGQIILKGRGIASRLEKLVPANIIGLRESRMRYSQLLNEKGGIIDDLMITNLGGDKGQECFFIVVNAACKENDIAHISSNIGQDIHMEALEDRALLALQGPMAPSVVARLWPQLADIPFMSTQEVELDGVSILASRCGYTGMDGYEFSLPNDKAENFARWLLGQEEVAPIGLGARDSLRLEAGLCLYGHDIDQTTSPIEANLAWSISKRRQTEGGFPGDEIIRSQIKNGTRKTLVGLQPEGRAPAREGATIENNQGEEIGQVTSGGFGPTVKKPVAMGYVEKGYEKIGAKVNLIVRGRQNPAHVIELPFVPASFYRTKK